ncbi:uncharacterized protein LOC144180192 [Haemaphysalis longicornis]
MRFTNPFVFLIQIATGLLVSPFEASPTRVTPKGPLLIPWPAGFEPICQSTSLHDYYPSAATGNAILWRSASYTSPEDIKQPTQGASSSGHGSSTRMRFTNPFVFLIQVSKRFENCFKSDDVFLLLLPCPRPVHDMLCQISASLRFLLLLSGDIEENPGPDEVSISVQLKAIAEDIAEIKKSKDSTNENLKAINKKLEKITFLEKQVSECMSKISQLEINLAAMTKKVDELENHSRRSNLIIYGVQEQPEETTELLQEIVTKKIFNDILDVRTSGFERIHRLGRPKPGEEANSRPIILKLVDYRDKAMIFKECTKLKGSDFSISEDFSRSVRDIRKKLWAKTKENRDRNEKVSLIRDKVRINNRLFAWNDETGDLISLEKNESQPPVVETRRSQRRRP